jgi:hypothetical protein
MDTHRPPHFDGTIFPYYSARLACYLETEISVNLVNRGNLKIINFEHTLYPGLELEINKCEFGVQKIVLLAMSCSINADNFGSHLKPI